MVACEKESTEKSNASISVDPQSVEIAAEGGEAEVSFATAGGSGSKVTVKEDASWLEAKVSGDVIKLTATANTTAGVREVVVAVKYEGAEAQLTVKQLGSEYDVVFQAKRFEGIYFGTEYSVAHNYYIILSDVGQWWGTDSGAKKEVQIDIVGSPVEGDEYIIGSCKYRNDPIGVDELELIKHYADVFGKGKKYHFYIFSKSGFTKGLKELGDQGEVKLITLDDMYR